jgi:hypothetical protein
MGLIRGALSLATFGAVASRSKKQRVAAMTLAATQGKSEQEVQIAGGRSFDAVNRADARAASARAARDGMTREQRQAQATVRAQMARYLRAGVITREDMNNTEVRLRKVWAYDGGVRGSPGLPPEEIDRRIAMWKQNVEQLRREGKIP